MEKKKPLNRLIGTSFKLLLVSLLLIFTASVAAGGWWIDFVVTGRGGQVHAIECKWNADAWSPRNLAAFRKLHPHGLNIALSPQLEPAMARSRGGFEVVFSRLAEAVSMVR